MTPGTFEVLGALRDTAADASAGHGAPGAATPRAGSPLHRLARITSGSGNPSTVAPSVPPKTMIAAVGCMIALYLSKDSARVLELRTTTDTLVRSGGSLVRLLLPILRAWRTLYDQRHA